MKRIFATLALALAVASPIAARADDSLATTYMNRCDAATEAAEYYGAALFCQDAAVELLTLASETNGDDRLEGRGFGARYLFNAAIANVEIGHRNIAQVQLSRARAIFTDIRDHAHRADLRRRAVDSVKICDTAYSQNGFR